MRSGGPTMGPGGARARARGGQGWGQGGPGLGPGGAMAPLAPPLATGLATSTDSNGEEEDFQRQLTRVNRETDETAEQRGDVINY